MQINKQPIIIKLYQPNNKENYYEWIYKLGNMERSIVDWKR